MKRADIRRQVGQMRRDWDRRALENARHYVATGQEEWSDADFFAAGEEELRNHILSDLGNICQGRDPKSMKVLEVGCGAGRVTRPLAQFFGEVYAVDISAHMVRQARRALADLRNVEVYCNNGCDLSAVRRRWWNRFGIGGQLEFDFVFSCLVFQHIASREVIANYVSEVNRLLKPGGLFKFQVQGSCNAQPNPGDTWVGSAVSREDARKLAQESGFELRYEWGAGTQYYWLWFFKR